MKTNFTSLFLTLFVLATFSFGRSPLTNSTVLRNTPSGGGTPSTISVSLLLYIDSVILYQPVDNTVVAFNDNYSNGLGNEDGPKLAGASDNISFNEGGVSLGVDGRKLPVLTDTIHIMIDQLSGTLYQFGVDASSYVSNGLNPYLHDAFKNTDVLLSVSSINYINFSVDNANKQTYLNRFYIIFKPASLPINNLLASAFADNGANKITWLQLGTKGNVTYIVEKSLDGIVFNTIGKTTNNLFIDNTSTETKVYYRIKAITNDGKVGYSNVMVVNKKANTVSLSVYPNPITNNEFKIDCSNIEKGKYEVGLFNQLGQQVYKETINHIDGVETISLKKNMTLGVYHLVVKGTVSSYQNEVEIK